MGNTKVRIDFTGTNIQNIWLKLQDRVNAEFITFPSATVILVFIAG